MGSKKRSAGAKAPAPAADSPPSKHGVGTSSTTLLVSALLVALIAAAFAYLALDKTPAIKSTQARAAEAAPVPAKRVPIFPRLYSVAAVKKRAALLPCKDRHDDGNDFCAKQAAAGGCEEGVGWMAVMCAASCGRCELLDPVKRCSEENMGIKLEDALRAGELNAMFERLAKLPNVEVLHESEPWVLLLRDFVSEKESSTILRLTKDSLKRSTDQGSIDADGFQTQIVTNYRTSSNSWCTHDCEKHPVVRNLTERISQLVGIPSKNFEQFQVLRYEKTQKYDVHHDSGPSDMETVAGPRVLTFFMYFSDVEEGGETHFPQLNLKVKPVKGAAVLWPSVKDQFPGSKIEPLTHHAALPVIKGIKYGANAWIHLREYHTPNEWGCTGAFDT